MFSTYNVGIHQVFITLLSTRIWCASLLPSWAYPLANLYPPFLARTPQLANLYLLLSWGFPR